MFRHAFLIFLCFPLFASQGHYESKLLDKRSAKDQVKAIDLISADFNDDGRTDILRLTQQGEQAHWDLFTLNSKGRLQEGQRGTLETAPDFAVSGDFDGDGRQDVIIATKEPARATFYSGGLSSKRLIKHFEFDAPITTIFGGQVNRPDTYDAFVVGLGGDQPKLVIYQDLYGLLQATPKEIALTNEPAKITTANLSDPFHFDILVANDIGFDLIHARDQGFPHEQNRTVIKHIPLAHGVQDLLWTQINRQEEALVVLDRAGQIRYFQEADLNSDAKRFQVSPIVAETHGQWLLATEAELTQNPSFFTLGFGRATQINVQRQTEETAFDIPRTAQSIVKLYQNEDAVSDMVVMEENGSLWNIVSKGTTTFFVNNGAFTDDGVCDAADCTFREAVAAANAESGQSSISFNDMAPGEEVMLGDATSPAGDFVLTFTERVTINGHTHPDGNVIMRGNSANTISGLEFTANSNYIRNIAIGDLPGGKAIFFDSQYNDIFASFIGIEPDGMTAMPVGTGIEINGDYADIGSRTSGFGCHIANGHFAIVANERTTLLNSLVGVDGTRNAMAGPQNSRIIVRDLMNVGDTISSSRNYIAANVPIFDVGASSYFIMRGNYINVKGDGSGRINDLDTLIEFSDNARLNIGSTGSWGRNVFGNTGRSIIEGESTYNSHSIMGNYFNRTQEGVDLGHTTVTIEFSSPVSVSTIGGTNRIFNTEYGIALLGATGGDNNLLNNRISANQLGIALGSYNVLPNDPGDIDSTPANYGQNYPQDFVVNYNAENELLLTYSLDSPLISSATSHTVHFFATSTETSRDGPTLLYEDTYNSDDIARGYKEINLGNAVTLNLGDRGITALAHNQYHGTSEYSDPLYLGLDPVTEIVVTSLDDTEAANCQGGNCTLRGAIIQANALGGTVDITFDLPGDPPYEIRINNSLPSIIQGYAIDGSTQPGFAGSPVITLTPISATHSFFNISTSGATIRAFNFTRATYRGITAFGQNNTIDNCHQVGENPSTYYDIADEGDGTRILNSSATKMLLGGSNGEMYGTYVSDELDVFGDLNTIGDAGEASRNVFNEIDLRGNYNNFRNNTFGISPDGTDFTESGIVSINGDGNKFGLSGDSDMRNFFASTATSLHLDRGSFNEITNNVFGLRPDGVTPLQGDIAIDIESSETNFVDENLITNNRIGIRSIGIPKIRNNQIGNDGTTPRPNEIGIHLVAGLARLTDNIISGNNQSGVVIESSDHLLRGNIIGLDPTGTTAVPNGHHGVNILSGTGIVIGDNDPLLYNTISGNAQHGIQVSSTASGITIAGNRIGTDLSGNHARGNGFKGISISNSAYNTIGQVDTPNIISGNSSGISIHGTHSIGNQVAYNLIGTNSTESEALPNYGIGLDLDNVSATVVTSNVIAGNRGAGLRIAGGNSQGNRIQGNRIGLTNTDTIVGNLASGILIDDAPNTTIGGPSPGQGNIVVGNALFGIHLQGKVATNNLIQGNFIGTNEALDVGLGNQNAGIFIDAFSNLNVIGAEQPNTIAYNTGDGIRILDAIGNEIGANHIFENNLLGIDLNGDGITLNDASDGDLGANQGMNFPEITSVLDNGANTDIAGTLQSHPNQNFVIHFYRSDACDASGYGEGAFYLGSTNTSTDGTGQATFNATVPGNVAVGQVITATARDQQFNTSEFSMCSGVSLFTDGFEGGTLAGWEQIGGSRATNIFASTEARYDGEYGLRVNPNTEPTYVRHQGPAKEPHFRLRFYVNASELLMEDGSRLEIFSAQNESGEEIFRLRLEMNEGQKQIVASVREDNNAWLDTSAANLEDGWRFVEINHLVGDGDGLFTLYLDDVETFTLNTLTNLNSPVDAINLGVLATPQGSISGHIDFDDFQAGRKGYVGPLSCTPAHFWESAIIEWPARNVTQLLDLATSYCR